MPTYESIGIAENISADWVSTGLTFDSNFSDRSIACFGVGYARLTVKAATQNAWFRFLVKTPVNYGAANQGEWPIALVYSSNDVLLAQLILPTTGAPVDSSFEFRYWNNSATTTHPIQTTLNSGSFYMFDVHVVTGAGTGRVEVYQDDNLIYNVTGLNNTTDTIRAAEMYAQHRTSTATASTTAFYSEFLVGIGDNSPTVGRRIFNRFPAANSAVNNTWTGGAAQINTGSRRTDGDMSFTDAAGNRQGYTITAATAFNSRIEAVGIYTQSFIGDGSPRGYAHSVRIGGINYDQAGLTITPTPKYYETVLYTNPATSTVWTVGAFNLAEWGVVST